MKLKILQQNTEIHYIPSGQKTIKAAYQENKKPASSTLNINIESCTSISLMSKQRTLIIFIQDKLNINIKIHQESQKDQGNVDLEIYSNIIYDI